MGGSDDELATVEHDDIEVWVIGVEETPEDGLGGGLGGTVADGAAEELAMGSDKAIDTKLLELGDWRRLYECAMGGRGEGPRRRQRRRPLDPLATTE
jgi:hypothetical protein